MSSKLLITFLLCFVVIACSSRDSTESQSNPPASQNEVVAPSASPAQSTAAVAASPVVAAAQPKVDACALLTSADIKAVQGEAVTETKLSGQTSGGFNLSQCFFSLPTFTNSISLLVAHRGDGADARDPKDFWRGTFYGPREREEEKDEKEEEEREGSPPEKVAGLGDEAFWIGNKVGGALYVLRGNSYVRISIGGPADAASRKRSRALAQKVISRL